mgnify:CR=1 FL=1|tara:strand:+ start:15315 stop:15782 length:468 start_codon:yes stop_codon:yes gene_type:complete
MAVATHVSRVSKDYAPHGYSIMETVCATVTTAAATDLTDPVISLMVDDADIWIEKVQLVALSALTADVTNYVEVSVNSMDSGAGVESVHASATSEPTGSGGLGNLVEDTFYDVPISDAHVPSGRVLLLGLMKSVPGNAGISGISGTVMVRYRRKA